MQPCLPARGDAGRETAKGQTSSVRVNSPEKRGSIASIVIDLTSINANDLPNAVVAEASVPAPLQQGVNGQRIVRSTSEFGSKEYRRHITAGPSSSANATLRSKPCGPVMELEAAPAQP